MHGTLYSNVGMAVGAFTIAACGSAPADFETELTPSAPAAEVGEAEVVAETEILAEMNVAGVEVSFLRLTDPSGAQRIVLHEMGPMNLTPSPLRDLAMARGLTALETFLALSPDDEYGPTALEEAHEGVRPA